MAGTRDRVEWFCIDNEINRKQLCQVFAIFCFCLFSANPSYCLYLWAQMLDISPTTLGRFMQHVCNKHSSAYADLKRFFLKVERVKRDLSRESFAEWQAQLVKCLLQKQHGGWEGYAEALEWRIKNAELVGGFCDRYNISYERIYEVGPAQLSHLSTGKSHSVLPVLHTYDTTQPQPRCCNRRCRTAGAATQCMTCSRSNASSPS